MAHLCQTRSPETPEAAGTQLSRRSFLLRSLGTAAAVYGASRLSGFALDDGIAQAAALDGGADRVLVSVFLPGGWDSMSVLAPVGDPKYRSLRRTTAVGEGDGVAFAEDDRLRWHPAAAPLAALHAEGKVVTLPGIGYDGPDQSHFTSRHYWEVGALDAGARTGWLGRVLDATGRPDNPLQGLALDGRLAPALATARVPVAAISSPRGFDFYVESVWGDVASAMVDTLGEFGAAHGGSGDPALRVAAAVAGQSQALRAQLAPFAGAKDDPLPAGYPKTDDQFPTRLAALAQLLAAGLPLRCVALTAPGDFDTHDDQADDWSQDIGTLSQSLLAFQRDLEARNIADRVLVHVWSEFGRRAEENGSRGTDHGAAGASFLIGTQTTGRMVGEFPGLGTLDEDGNLRATSDFRALYASLCEQWLGVDAAQVLPGAARLGRYAVVR